MKQFLAAVTALIMGLSMTACGDDDGNGPAESERLETVEPTGQTPMTTPDGVETFEPIAP